MYIVLVFFYQKVVYEPERESGCQMLKCSMGMLADYRFEKVTEVVVCSLHDSDFGAMWRPSCWD